MHVFARRYDVAARQMSGVQELVQTIRSSSDQQMSGIDQVSRSVEGMTRTTHAAAESAVASATPAATRISTCTHWT